MIAPARRAAYDALLAHAVNGTDLAAAVERASARGLDGAARPDAAHRTGQRHRAHAQGHRSSAGAAVHAAAGCPRRRGARLAAARGVSADLPGSRAGLGRGERRRGADAARRQDQRGRHGERRASRAVARSRAAGLAGRAGAGGARASATRIPSGWWNDGSRATAASERERWLAFNNRGAPSVPGHEPAARDARGAGRSDCSPRGWRPSPRAAPRTGCWSSAAPALSTEAFREGRFVVQDEASQLITELGPVAPGHRVLDLCAAPGGKTVALAARCEPGGAGRGVRRAAAPRAAAARDARSGRAVPACRSCRWPRQATCRSPPEPSTPSWWTRRARASGRCGAIPTSAGAAGPTTCRGSRPRS